MQAIIPFVVVMGALIIIFAFISTTRTERNTHDSEGQREYLPIPEKKREYLPTYGVESVSNSWIIVKSWKEKKIADYLDRKKIRYIYEPLTEYYLKPDFYLPDYDVYIEYWGLLSVDDDFTRIKYIKKYKEKKEKYDYYNLKLIDLYPENLKNIDIIFRKKFKFVTGLDLPNWLIELARAINSNETKECVW